MFPLAISEIAMTNPNFNAQLKSYLIKPVIQQVPFIVNYLIINDCDKMEEFVNTALFSLFVKYSLLLVDRKG